MESSLLRRGINLGSVFTAETNATIQLGNIRPFEKSKYDCFKDYENSLYDFIYLEVNSFRIY